MGEWGKQLQPPFPACFDSFSCLKMISRTGGAMVTSHASAASGYAKQRLVGWRLSLVLAWLLFQLTVIIFIYFQL